MLAVLFYLPKNITTAPQRPRLLMNIAVFALSCAMFTVAFLVVLFDLTPASTFVRLFKTTTPHQLFDESLRAEGVVESSDAHEHLPGWCHLSVIYSLAELSYRPRWIDDCACTSITES